jgi:hypothetical protein
MCRCGYSVLPKRPTRPMASPALTVVPGRTLMLSWAMWQYCVSKPSSWPMMTPLPHSLPSTLSVPLARTETSGRPSRTRSTLPLAPQARRRRPSAEPCCEGGYRCRCARRSSSCRRYNPVRHPTGPHPRGSAAGSPALRCRRPESAAQCFAQCYTPRQRARSLWRRWSSGS